MKTLFKGADRTLSAQRHSTGISLGFYPKNGEHFGPSFVSLEYHNNKPVLYINKTNCDAEKIDIVFTDNTWGKTKATK